ncbi:hypothetical protein [Cytobacillus praedii]|uniref:hypothetical protein n=1 Tax=Cytobacillus praedii TaxID=1742358 RepID=UPI002E1C9221|nr:hypothetical protein [Cytobacillus praedii]
MPLNPHFKILIQYQEGQEKWVEIMKQEFKERIIQERYDYFAVIEEAEKNMIVSFIPSRYLEQKEFNESFEKNVLEPARKAAGLKQA